MELSEKAQWRLSLGYKYFNEEPRNVPAAAREFNRVTQLAPNWSQGYALLAAACEEMGNIDRAISTCRAAMQVVPEDAQHLITLGRIYIRKHDYTKAVKILRKAILLRPQNGEENAHLLLIEALDAMGRKSG